MALQHSHVLNVNLCLPIWQLLWNSIFQRMVFALVVHSLINREEFKEINALTFFA